MDVTMAEPVSEADFLENMNRAMPPELKLTEARAVDDRHPSLMGLLRAAQYDILIRELSQAEKIIPAIGPMMERESIPAMRKTKTALKECNIKPLIHEIRGEGQHIYAMLTLTEREACKPGMLMEALQREAGMDDDVRILITRTGLYGENEEGKLAPLEQL